MQSDMMRVPTHECVWLDAGGSGACRRKIGTFPRFRGGSQEGDRVRLRERFVFGIRARRCARSVMAGCSHVRTRGLPRDPGPRRQWRLELSCASRGLKVFVVDQAAGKRSRRGFEDREPTMRGEPDHSSGNEGMRGGSTETIAFGHWRRELEPNSGFLRVTFEQS
jgi:hypothetical protein